MADRRTTNDPQRSLGAMLPARCALAIRRARLAVDVRLRVYVEGHTRLAAVVAFDRAAMPSGTSEGTSVPIPQGFDPKRGDLVGLETEFADASGACWRVTNDASGRNPQRIRSGTDDYWRPR